MQTVNVNIQPSVMEWAWEQSGEEMLGEEMTRKIKNWLEGTKTPTFRQIEELSKKSHIPLGYFFLQAPPDENVSLIEYRTVDSIKLEKPSRDLIDKISEMDRIQDWMRTYRRENGMEPLGIVGCAKDTKDACDVVDMMRDELGLDYKWFEEFDSSRELFKYVRDRLEECGVIVMMSGIVGENTHRPLDVDEFRAFAMADEWAPLIFINAADSEGAKLFSLLHEAAHICMGENDLYNDMGQKEIRESRRLEEVCNAAAAELLVPVKEFSKNWNENLKDVFDKVTDLARHFHCSQVVVARKALDYHEIDRTCYDEIAARAYENYRKMKEQRGSGGNYYNTKGSRLDGAFVRALCESIATGRTSYTEAYRLTSTNAGTFPKVAAHFGGAVC